MTRRIVFLDRATLPVPLREPNFQHVWQDHEKTSADQIVERLNGATIAIVNKVPLRRESLTALPELKNIALAATGTDNVDLDFCRERNIAVSNIRGYSKYTVPEHVFALILALRRNLFSYAVDVKQGVWQQADQFCFFSYPILDLFGSTLGIIGSGTIGKNVANIGKAFGMRILFAERKNAQTIREGYTDFNTVLKESDIISLHCPLTADTRNMLGMNEFLRMKESALLINTSRGGLVDELALVSALNGKIIGGAGFDVLSKEPPKVGNPLLDVNSPNFILTPHVAWASLGAMTIMANQLIDNIEAFVHGEQKNRVV